MGTGIFTAVCPKGLPTLLVKLRVLSGLGFSLGGAGKEGFKKNGFLYYFSST
jgi:hypothetical protein